MKILDNIVNKRKNDMILDSSNITLSIYHRMIKWKRLALLKRIREGLDDEGYVFLFPYRGTGDIFLAASYLKDYVNRHNIKSYALCVVGGSGKRICEKLFKFDNVKTVSPLDAESLLNLGMFVGFDTSRIFVLHADPPQLKSGISDRMRNYNEYNFLDMFTGGVFGKDIEPTPPIFEDYKAEAQDFFKNNNMAPGKTIIIAPHVNTLDKLPNWFWVNLVEKLKEMGYTVCTNCTDGEKPILGTMILNLPYEKMKSYLEYAGTFVSSRNGLCEIVSSFDCKKIVIYNPYHFWGPGRNIDYFSMKKMGICDDVVELEYEGKDFSTLIKNIVENLPT